jgi:hypothetical protein
MHATRIALRFLEVGSWVYVIELLNGVVIINHVNRAKLHLPLRSLAHRNL